MIEVKFNNDRVYIKYNAGEPGEEDMVVKLVKSFQADENIVEVVLSTR